MKISLNWLKNYLPDLNLSSEELISILNNTGLEVESVQKFETIKGELKGLIVGEIVEKLKHPNADKLYLTKVSIGNGRLLNIVCGAPNVEKGQKVVVAPAGTKIYPKNSGELKIKKVKIRGQISEGMICAEDEIGLGDKHDEIIILPSNYKTGKKLIDYLKPYNDTVFEIALTPNRTDAMGHIGVARDIKAHLNFNQNKNLKLKLPIIDDNNFEIKKIKKDIKIIIENNNDCNRYSGIVIENVKVEESPQWLKNYLISISQKPVNNIVDIANFVMFETGHPLHIFDYDKIKNNTIIIRRAKEKEKFTTLFNDEVELSSNDLIISDIEKTLCIAGVLGGKNSAVTDKTKNIFIESAYFNPELIRKTAKKYNFHSEASFRFERGADPNITVFALKRAALLIKKIANGTFASKIKDIYEKKINPVIVDFDFQKAKQLIGKDISKKEMIKIFNELDYKVKDKKIVVPTYRRDVKRQIDLIEELLRIYGYNNIEISEKLNYSISYSYYPEKNNILNSLSNLLISNGFYEIINNSLSKKNYYTKENGWDESKNIEINNPLSSDLQIMRRTLLYGGLENILLNKNHKNNNLKLFEIGKIYEKFNNKFLEQERLSLWITGDNHNEHWKHKAQKVDFFTLKGYCFLILNKILPDILNNKYLKYNEAQTSQDKNFKYITKVYYKNNVLLLLSSVSNKLLKKFDIKDEVYFADFYLDNIINIAKKNKTIYKELHKYPYIRRDLSLLVEKNIKYDLLKKIAIETCGQKLKNINIFDFYEGKNIPKNKKSYALSFIFRDDSKTLTDEEINKLMNKLINKYKQEINAKIR